MVTMRRMAVVVCCVVFLANSVRAADPIDWGGVTEKHEMIPMRDGMKLSAAPRVSLMTGNDLGRAGLVAAAFVVSPCGAL